jgi:hypothetical protein
MTLTNALRRCVLVAASFAVSSAQTSVANAEEVRAGMVLYQTGESAAVHSPDCSSGGPTAADVVLKVGAAVLDRAIGAPVTSAILNNLSPGNVDWLKARLGLHNGKSACATQCVVYPAGVNARLEAGMGEHPGHEGLRWFDHPGEIDWGAVENFSTATTGKAQLFCAQGKNWSHNRNRVFYVKATY